MLDKQESQITTEITRKEIRKRSFVAKIIKWVFIQFNVLMLVWMLSHCSSAGQMIYEASSEAEKAGGAIGATMGSGLLLSIWMAGAVMLGILTFLKCGRKTRIDEEVQD